MISPSQRKQLRRWDLGLTAGCLTVVVVVVVLLLAKQFRLSYSEPITDPARYQRCLKRAQAELDPQSLQHFPHSIPADASDIQMYFREDWGDRGMTLILSYRTSPSGIIALKAMLKDKAIQADSWHTLITLGQPQGDTPWELIGLPVEETGALSENVETIPLYEGGRDTGTDWTTAGFAIDPAQEKVVYWVHRHWVQYN